ncbi:MAG TPA: TonB-dependent receptor [Cellvibrio sp.]|nr:TonB-dependent receptor [Cellvibrio sp.]
MPIHHRPLPAAKKILASIMSVIALTSLSGSLYAQIGSASLSGVIDAQDQPIVGAAVTVVNIANGHTYKAVTQATGGYSFTGLPPGDYRLTVAGKQLQGQQKVTLKVGQKRTLNIDLAESDLTQPVQELVVIGIQEKETVAGEIGTSISLEQIESLPQTTRNFLSFADLAPGVQFNEGQDGSTSIQGGAQSPNAINIFIDGVGQKNYVLRGGVTGQDASRGNPFPQSAIAEYKVITQNYSAEYDQLSSAAIVAVTASGSNEFHGGFFYDYSDEGMREKNPNELKNNKKIPSQQIQYGVNVGGPIIKDKLHFFFAYEGKSNSDPREVVVGAGYDVNKLTPSVQAKLGGVSASFEEDLFFGKLSYAINDAQKLELTAKYRDETELTGVGDQRPIEFGTDKNNDETRVALSHNWRTDNWINDARLTYEDYTFNPRPHTFGNGTILLNAAKNIVLNTGAGRDYQEKSQSGWGLQEDFTYIALDNHQIKTGIKYKQVDLTSVEQQPFNPQYNYNIDYSWDQPYLVEWGAPLTGIGNGSVDANNKQFGLYIQDDWSATDRLTINAGLRWDYEESDAYLDYQTPDDVVTALRGWSNLDNSNINAEDYISTGNNRDSFKDAWQPRLGFSYDLGTDNELVLFGGAGRAYDRNLFDNLQLEATKATFPTYRVNFDSEDPQNNCDPAATNCVAWDPRYLTAEGLEELLYANTGAGREVYMVNNNLKTPYSDQFSLGMRGSFSIWNAEVSLSHIKSEDGFVWMLMNRRPDGNFFEPGATWGQPWAFGIPGFSNGLIGMNGLESKADSLYVKLDKPKEDDFWGLTLAYTYTDAQDRRKSGEVFALDYPEIEDYGWHDSLSVPEHRLVIAGLFDLPAGFDFSAKLNLESVKTYQGTDCRAGWNACFYNTFQPDGDGFLGYKQLDIAISKQFATGMIAQDSFLTLRLDILNVTNAVNHGGYQDWFGGAGEDLPDNFGQPNGTFSGPPTTLKLGVNWTF